MLTTGRRMLEALVEGKTTPQEEAATGSDARNTFISGQYPSWIIVERDFHGYLDRIAFGTRLPPEARPFPRL